MFIKNWKTEVFTIPNLLSLVRLGLIPVYLSIYRSASRPEDYWLAGSVLALSCLTDGADGYIARRWNMTSNLGKVLDPVADKLTQFALTLCLSRKYPVLDPVLGLFVVKEVFQAAAGIRNLRRGKMLPGALMAGKVCTAVLFVSLIALVLLPDPDHRLVTLTAVVDGGFLLVSFLCYLLAYTGKNRKLQDL